MVFKLGCTYNNCRRFAPFLYTKKKKKLFISLSSYPIIFFLFSQIPQTQFNFYTYPSPSLLPVPTNGDQPNPPHPPSSLFFSLSYKALLSLPHFSFFLLSFPSTPLVQAPPPSPISFYFFLQCLYALPRSVSLNLSSHCCDFLSCVYSGFVSVICEIQKTSGIILCDGQEKEREKRLDLNPL